MNPCHSFLSVFRMFLLLWCVPVWAQSLTRLSMKSQVVSVSEDMQKAKVRFLLDDWKYHFGWKDQDIYRNHNEARRIEARVQTLLEHPEIGQNNFLIYSQQPEQEDYWQGAVYLELGGPGLLTSVNWEHRPHPNFTGRMGLSFFPLVLAIQWGLIFSLSYISHANSSHHLEAGLGVSHLGVIPIFPLLVGGRSVSETFPTAILGYRYQPQTSGFVFRVSFTPIILTLRESEDSPIPTIKLRGLNKEILLWGGISFGFCWLEPE